MLGFLKMIQLLAILFIIIQTIFFESKIWCFGHHKNGFYSVHLDCVLTGIICRSIWLFGILSDIKIFKKSLLNVKQQKELNLDQFFHIFSRRLFTKDSSGRKWVFDVIIFFSKTSAFAAFFLISCTTQLCSFTFGSIRNVVFFQNLLGALMQ